MKVKIALTEPDAKMPRRMSDGAAGFDLFANRTMAVHRGETAKIPCGFRIEVPEGYEAHIRPRSGYGSRGILVPNAPGTIDSDYRGEVCVLLLNISGDALQIRRGDRIAQMVIQAVPQVELVEVEDLAATERGSGGFGSTGR